MKNQTLLQQKVKKLKELTREIEKLVTTDRNLYTIIANWESDTIITGLYDTNGQFLFSGPKIISKEPLTDLSYEDQFRIVSKGIHRAIAMIPPLALTEYLKEDGPQITLKLHPKEMFQTEREEIKELADTMLDHFKNYRIQMDDLSQEEYEELLEIE